MTKFNSISKLRISLVVGFVLAILFSGTKITANGKNLFFLPDFAVEVPHEDFRNHSTVTVIDINDDVETSFYFMELLDWLF